MKYDLILNNEEFIIVPRLEAHVSNGNTKPDLNAIQHVGTTSASGLYAYKQLSPKLTKKILDIIKKEIRI